VVDVGEQHQQPVDPDAEPARRGQAVLEGAHVVLVDGHRLLVTACLLGRLLVEAGALLDGVDELGERVADLTSGDDRLEPLDQPRHLAVVARERRHLLRVVAHEDRPPQLGLGGLLVDLEHELARPPAAVGRDAELGGDGAQLVDGHGDVDVDARLLLDELGHRRPAPRWRQVEGASLERDLRRAAELGREVGDELLRQRHHVGVVRVGLIELEHRELGVPAIADAFVAEHPSDLEDALEPRDDQALQVELRCDPEIELEIERVVVGRERFGEGASGNRVEQRRLHLDEPAVFQPSPHEAHHAAAHHERAARLLRDPQVDVALAVPGVDVGDAVPLVRELAAGFGQEHPVLHPHRELARLRLHDLAGRPHPVAMGQRDELVEAGGRPGGTEQLQAARAVLQREERELAHGPVQHQPARHRHGDAALLPRRERVELLVQRRRGPVGLEPVGRLAHVVVFFWWMSRSPWSVSHGSRCSMVSDSGAMRLPSPPVAITVLLPSSSSKRRTMPSTSSTVP
jgi:hypothetical protein